MSESFFGLRKRPFAALPNVDCFVPLNGICQAYDGLLQTTLEGRGIGMLTAPAGLGKTLVCQRLARELSNRFSVVFLPSGNFLTRRSLLQAILFELGHSFVRMGDQELRLALSAMLQAIRPTRQGLVLIVDEAHLMATRMLEELRALLNLGEGDEPLVRLIVSGQLGLEETLSRPQCDAFNQRIACQVMLPSLTRDESTSYITRRLAWAGANVSEVFARDALAAICEAVRRRAPLPASTGRPLPDAGHQSHRKADQPPHRARGPRSSEAAAADLGRADRRPRHDQSAGGGPRSSGRHGQCVERSGRPRCAVR